MSLMHSLQNNESDIEGQMMASKLVKVQLNVNVTYHGI